jgi:hypothetical protein
MQFDRLASISVSLTVGAMFFIVRELSSVLGMLGLPSYAAVSVVGLFASAGVYKLIASGLFWLFRKSLFLRRLVLGSAFVEGTWVGHYERQGAHRFTIEVFKQSDGKISMSGREFEESGKTRASWHSEAATIDQAKMRLLYTYTADVFERKHQQQGLAVFDLIIPQRGRTPNIMDGYATDLIDGDRDPNKEYKISDKVVSDEWALSQARDRFLS